MGECFSLKIRLLAAQKRDAEERRLATEKREAEYRKGMMKRARHLVRLLRKVLNLKVTLEDIDFNEFDASYTSCSITYTVQRTTYGMFGRMVYQLWGKGIVCGGVKTVMADGTLIGQEVGYPIDDILALQKFHYFNPNGKYEEYDHGCF